jgi:hypothetical protein
MIRKSLLAALILSVASAVGAHAYADPGVCHFVDVDFTPTADLQIVAWIEDTKGNYVDTAYITQATGSFGIGNRPWSLRLQQRADVAVRSPHHDVPRVVARARHDVPRGRVPGRRR